MPAGTVVNVGSYLGRTRAELARAHDELVTWRRAAYASGQLQFIEPHEDARHSGVMVTYRWLTDPRQTVGPLYDGPANPETLERTLRGALYKINSWRRDGPIPDHIARCVGILQMIQYALGWTEEPLTVWPQGEQSAAA